jgi:hypothetical protein
MAEMTDTDINVSVTISFTSPDRETAEADIANLTAPEGASVSVLLTEIIASGTVQDGEIVPPAPPAPPEVQPPPAQEEEPPVEEEEQAD